MVIWWKRQPCMDQQLTIRNNFENPEKGNKECGFFKNLIWIWEFTWICMISCSEVFWKIAVMRTNMMEFTLSNFVNMRLRLWAWNLTKIKLNCGLLQWYFPEFSREVFLGLTVNTCFYAEHVAQKKFQLGVRFIISS